MPGLDWFLYANAALWLGLGAYAAFLARQQGRLEQRLARLERCHDQD